jgi:hypothetical protein
MMTLECILIPLILMSQYTYLTVIQTFPSLIPKICLTLVRYMWEVTFNMGVLFMIQALAGSQ